MDRDAQQLRDEAFGMDEASQLWLAEELTEHLRQRSVDRQWNREIERRLEEYRRGEGKSLTREESLERARKMIAGRS